MPINSDKPHLWKADVMASVDLYNMWFLSAAPAAFRESRARSTERVKVAFSETDFAINQLFDLEKIEAERSTEQVRLDGRSSRQERNELGQFATPAALAADITKAVIQFRDFDQISFLEPALGTGAFFGALLRQVPSAKIISAVGIEIDDARASVARRLWKETGLRVITE